MTTLAAVNMARKVARWKSARAFLWEDGGITSLSADKPGRGDGSGLLLALCQYADTFQLKLYLNPAPFSHRAKSKIELVKWYRKFGFRVDQVERGYIKMIRSPILLLENQEEKK